MAMAKKVKTANQEPMGIVQVWDVTAHKVLTEEMVIWEKMEKILIFF